MDAGFDPEQQGSVAESAGRQGMRNAMFLQAELRRTVGGEDAPQVLRVRNLSAGGLMLEAGGTFTRGEQVILTLRNIGEVAARVAWTDGGRIGFAFDRPIDPKQVRKAPPKSPGAGMQLIRPQSPHTRRPGVRTGPV